MIAHAINAAMAILAIYLFAGCATNFRVPVFDAEKYGSIRFDIQTTYVPPLSVPYHNPDIYYGK